ncbi:MAG: hypothetical protein WCP09_03150 [Candidatus Taylorbacteria bacterium]
MKKISLSLATLALFITVAIPFQTMAQEQESEQKPPARNIPAKIRAELRSDLKEKQDNLRTNQDIRNNIREKMMGGNASTTWATTTRGNPNMPFRGQNEDGRGYMNNSKAMLFNMFQLRKNIIVRELQSAVNNLTNVESRLQSRIDKVASTSERDMTAAKALLITADAKIKIAQTAIDTIKNLTATSTAATTASSTIDLNKPRIMADDAQKAIRDAQKSLNDVVVAIAKAMGLKLGNQN